MDNDGIDDAIGNMMRSGLAVAGRLGEQLARLNENRMRHAEAASAQEQRELQSRFDTERLAARASLAPIGRDEWWENADPKQIIEAWQTATVWREHDPEIGRAGDRIRAEVSERFGVDAQSPGANPEAMQSALRAIVEADQMAEEKRTQAKRDEREAAALLLEADRMAADREHGLVDDVQKDIQIEDKLREKAAEHFHAADLSTRDAEHFEGVADREAHRVKQVADRGQAYPASEATNPEAGVKVARARRSGQGQTARQERTISR